MYCQVVEKKKSLHLQSQEDDIDFLLVIEKAWAKVWGIMRAKNYVAKHDSRQNVMPFAHKRRGHHMWQTAIILKEVLKYW